MDKLRIKFIAFGRKYIASGDMRDYLKAQEALMDIELSVYKEIARSNKKRNKKWVQ